MLAGASQKNSIKGINKDLQLQKDTNGFIELGFEFLAPGDFSNDLLKSFFVKEKDTIEMCLAHELKHAYDSYKKNTMSVKSAADYRSAKSYFGDIKPLNTFANNLYYIHRVEELVRPSEVAYYMKSKGIKKDEFYNFITNNETYKNLKQIRETTYESFRKELINYIPQIRELINEVTDLSVGKMSDKEIIDEILKMTMYSIGNKKIDAVHGIFKNDTMQKMGPMGMFELMLGRQPDDPLMPKKIEFLEKYHAEVSKFEDRPNDYFKFEIGRMSKKAGETMKKLAKLFADAEANESILNWDLWNQVNGNIEDWKNSQGFISINNNL